jgi:uncharacterized membrane protein YoaK (UPF0700 family)
VRYSSQHSSGYLIDMPLDYLRGFTRPERTDQNNRRLGQCLAFIAGAANAGGFLAVGQYTSHMSGIVSSIADNLSADKISLVVSGFTSLAAFMAGAATSAIIINWGRRRRAQSEYSLPLMLEAMLLLAFGLLGSNLEHDRILFVPATVAVLCYVMGLQNAMITKISKAEIRTTHVTGLVTDIGIELGKLLYWNVSESGPGVTAVKADRSKLGLLTSLLCMFFTGGLAGTLGFRYVGFVSTLPLSAILVLLAVMPLVDDLVAQRR